MGVLVSLEGKLGTPVSGYHMIDWTKTRCDVDVIVINDCFMEEVLDRYGVSVDEARDVEFWRWDERARDVIRGWGEWYACGWGKGKGSRWRGGQKPRGWK